MNESSAIFTPEASTNSTVFILCLIMNKVDIAIFALNTLFGLLTHSYIIWLIVTGTGSGIALELFNLNLSICELLYSLNCLLCVLSILFPNILRIALFFIGTGVIGRPLFYCLICLERYLAVVHPVTFLKYKPLRYKVICCTAVWIICLGCCFICAFVLYTPNFFKLICMLSIQFLLFFFVQLYFCVAVLRTLKQSGPGERGREREEENNMKRRAFNLILMTTVTTVVMFVPYIITGILTFLDQDFSVCWSFSLFCFILAAFVHPVLYLQRNGKLNFLSSPK